MKYIYFIIIAIVIYLVWKSRNANVLVINHGAPVKDSVKNTPSWISQEIWESISTPLSGPIRDPNQFNQVGMDTRYFSTMPPSQDLRTVASKNLSQNQY